MTTIAVGQTLPELAIPITASAIVAGAIATNDYENVHHDKAAAQATGVPDIFMNILTTNGLVQRYVSDWSGPSARIASVDIRLGAPNFVGDTMRMTGEVARVEVLAVVDEELVDLVTVLEAPQPLLDAQRLPGPDRGAPGGQRGDPR